MIFSLPRHFLSKGAKSVLYRSHSSANISGSPPPGQNDRLLKEICAKIRFSGPITVAQYMQEVLSNPVSGYYTTRNHVLGSKGDFITSPEISQMFGECVAIYLLNEWQMMGSPKPFQLVELGPGRGTLMQDILRTMSKIFPHQMEHVSVHLVEISDNLRKIQQAQLCGYFQSDPMPNNDEKSISKYGPEINWYQDLRRVPKAVSFFVAHEFFDALPIHKFVRNQDGWHEILIDVDKVKSDALRFVKSRNATLSSVFIDPTESKTELEVCPTAGSTMRHICERLTFHGGLALVADYGHEGDKGDTFRAFKNHQLHDPLLDAGSADLTADVDFSYLKKNCTESCLVYGPVEQRQFLTLLGIDVRKEKLIESCNKVDIKRDILTSYDMLMDPANMGERFKFMSVYPKTMKPIHEKCPPAGFPPNIK